MYLWHIVFWKLYTCIYYDLHIILLTRALHSQQQRHRRVYGRRVRYRSLFRAQRRFISSRFVELITYSWCTWRKLADQESWPFTDNRRKTSNVLSTRYFVCHMTVGRTVQSIISNWRALPRSLNVQARQCKTINPVTFTHWTDIVQIYDLERKGDRVKNRCSNEKRMQSSLAWR